MVRFASSLLLAGLAAAIPVEEFMAKRQMPACAKANATLPTNVNSKALPDPFTFWDGTKVATMDDWKCRQAQLQYALEQTELGDYPGPPDTFQATASGQGISISMGVGGQTATFSATVGGSGGGGGAASGAVIAYGFPSVTVPAGVRTITFSNDQFAQQQGGASRGRGIFYNLFGAQHSAGALTAWAWGVDRIMDALEELGEGLGIDPKRVAVTGCSRNGKGAFVAGALVPRIALTIPQESGSGGAACWRISDDEKAKGKNIQHAGQIVGENPWFSSRFNAWTPKINQDPVDHEALVALISPRGLYIPENDIDWLGPVSTTGCMQSAQKIYAALGVPTNMGFSLTGGHNHCSFPGNQGPEISQFWAYFITGGTTKPSLISKSTVNVPIDQWSPWTLPEISGTYDAYTKI